MIIFIIILAGAILAYTLEKTDNELIVMLCLLAITIAVAVAIKIVV